MTAAEAVAERDQVLSEVEIAKRRQIDAGLDVLRRWAEKGRPFSLNDCRAELRAVGVTGQHAAGALTMRAIALKIIRKVDRETSSSGPTHGKDIGKYVAADQPAGLATLIPTAPAGETVTVPTVRDDRGRFTRNPSTPIPDALFDIDEGTR